MRHTTLDRSELNRRCDQVFDLTVFEYVYDVYITDDNRVVIEMSVLEGREENFIEYEPDMSDRPTSLEYIMGTRDDFND